MSVADRDACSLQAEAINVWTTANGHHHHIGIKLHIIGQLEVERTLRVIGFLNRLENRIRDHAHTGFFQPLVHFRADVHIEAVKDRITAIDQARLDAEACEHVRKFTRDITAASNDDMLRQGFQLEHAIRGNRVLNTRQFLFGWAPR